jgi:hypothetical protein
MMGFSTKEILMSNDINKPSVHFNDVLKEAIDNPSRRNILRGGLG